jgi:hypothetical protein
MLTKEQILAADDITRESLDVPEWGGTIQIRVMSGTQRDKFEQAFSADRYNNTRARMAVYSVCDEAGKHLFDESDIPALGAKSSAILDRIFPVAMRVNKMGTDEIQELEKNSGASPSAGSPTGSPRTLA